MQIDIDNVMSTSLAGEECGMKYGEIIPFVQKYGIKVPRLPGKGGRYLWTEETVAKIHALKADIDHGRRCDKCGQTLPVAPVEILATDEGPGDAE